MRFRIPKDERNGANRQPKRAYQSEKDTLYYLRGNAYRKKGDWKQALDNYQFAIDINPEGPAVQARKMVIDILNFYHKDMFNQ